MAFSVTKPGSNTNTSWTLSGLSTKIDPILDKFGKFVWYNGYGLTDPEGNILDYDTATNNQKFTAINKRLKALALDEANRQEDLDARAVVSPKIHDLDKIS